MPKFKVVNQSNVSKSFIGDVVGQTLKQDTRKADDNATTPTPYTGTGGWIPLQTSMGRAWFFPPEHVEEVPE